MRFLAVLLALFVSASALAQAIHPGRVAGPEYATKPAADFDFLRVRGLPYEITCTRASSATFRDATGTRQTAAANQMRFDHDKQGNPLGLLIEVSRTNFLLNSTAPVTQTTGSLSATNPYTLTIEGSGSVSVAGNTATITGGGSATEGAPLTFTVTSSGTVDVTVTGTVTAFQIELGSHGTSLIVTAGATETRQQDLCSAPIPWFNPAEGTLFVEYIPEFNAATSGTMVSLSDGSTNNRIDLNAQTSGVYRMIGQRAAATFARSDSGVFSNGGLHRMAGAYRQGDNAAAVDGQLSTANLVNSAFSSLIFDRILFAPANGAGGASSVWLRRVAYWPTRLENARLLNMTAP